MRLMRRPRSALARGAKGCDRDGQRGPSRPPGHGSPLNYYVPGLPAISLSFGLAGFVALGGGPERLWPVIPNGGERSRCCPRVAPGRQLERLVELVAQQVDVRLERKRGRVMTEPPL